MALPTPLLLHGAGAKSVYNVCLAEIMHSLALTYSTVTQW